MNAKGWAISAGLGAAAGMVAVLMMPRNNPTRKLAAKAADKMEDVAWTNLRICKIFSGTPGFRACRQFPMFFRLPGRRAGSLHPPFGQKCRKWASRSCR